MNYRDIISIASGKHSGDPDAWLTIRPLHKRLVHEYVDDLSDLNAALGEARALAQELHPARPAISAYTSARLALDS